LVKGGKLVRPRRKHGSRGRGTRQVVKYDPRGGCRDLRGLQEEDSSEGGLAKSGPSYREDGTELVNEKTDGPRRGTKKLGGKEGGSGQRVGTSERCRSHIAR